MAELNEERRKAFVVYATTFESAVKYLSQEELGELFVKLGRYSLYGEDTHSDIPMIDILLEQAKPVMDSAEKRHAKAVENGSKGKEFGSEGGRPRKGETKEEAYERRKAERGNPEKPLDKDIDRDIDKDRDKDRDKDKERDIETDKDTERSKQSLGISSSTSQLSCYKELNEEQSSCISQLEEKNNNIGEDSGSSAGGLRPVAEITEKDLNDVLDIFLPKHHLGIQQCLSLASRGNDNSNLKEYLSLSFRDICRANGFDADIEYGRNAIEVVLAQPSGS